MDTRILNEWRQIIKKILAELAAIPFPEVVNLKAKTVFDESSDIYMVLVEGWQDVKRMHGCLLHVEINDGKIWIQQDGTEDGVPTSSWSPASPKTELSWPSSHPKPEPIPASRWRNSVHFLTGAGPISVPRASCRDLACRSMPQ